MKLKPLFVLSMVTIAVVSACAYLFVQYLLMVTDISTRPLTDSYLTQMQKKRPMVYLISYADGHEMFHRNQLTLAASSLGRGVDAVINYNRSMIDPSFIVRNKAIFDQKPGAGFWLWKPWIIAHTLKNVPEGSIVVYVDTGLVLKNDITPLVAMLKDKPVLGFVGNVKTYGHAREFVKPEIFDALKANNQEAYQAPLVVGGVMFISNTKSSRDFIDVWLQHCQNEHLLTNMPTQAKLPNSPYRIHLHDQSILSVVAAKYKDVIATIPFDEVLLEEFMAWHHRRPGVNAEELLFQHKSLLPYYGKNVEMNKFEKFFYNFFIFKYIRKLFF